MICIRFLMRGASIVLALSLVACGKTEKADAVQTLDATHVSDVAVLAQACSGCHAVGSQHLADLTTFTSHEIATRFRAYKEDAVGRTVMHRIAQGYSDEDITNIAAFLASRKEL